MSNWNDDSIDLERPEFLRGSLREMEQRAVTDEFGAYISDVVGMINDGKEATVYLCRAKPQLGTEYAAAKVYRARKFRAFSNEAQYIHTGRMRDRRMAKAIRSRSRKGRRAAHFLWQQREWEALSALQGVGASVPAPYALGSRGILMEYVGDVVDGHAVGAPTLVECRLSGDDAEAIWRQVLRDLECLMDCGLVHGDLSAYNILLTGGRPRLIDLPQAVQIDEAPDAWDLFCRDIDNIARYFIKQGMAIDAVDLAIRLWQRR
jgi:RIO kinase 1